MRTKKEAHEGKVIRTQDTAARSKGDNPSTTFLTHKRGDPSTRKFVGQREDSDNVKRGDSVSDAKGKEGSTGMDTKNGKRDGDLVKRGHHGAGNANWKGKPTIIGGGNGQRGGVHAKRGHGARSANNKGSPTAAAIKASSGGRGQRDGSIVKRGQCAENASGKVLPTTVRRNSGDQRNYGGSVKRGASGASGAGSAKVPISIFKHHAAVLVPAGEKKQVKFSQLYFSRNRSRKQSRNYSSTRATCKRSNDANVDTDMAQFLANAKALELECELTGEDYWSVHDSMLKHQMSQVGLSQFMLDMQQYRELTARAHAQIAAKKESAAMGLEDHPAPETIIVPQQQLPPEAQMIEDFVNLLPDKVVFEDSTPPTDFANQKPAMATLEEDPFLAVFN